MTENVDPITLGNENYKQERFNVSPNQKEVRRKEIENINFLSLF